MNVYVLLGVLFVAIGTVLTMNVYVLLGVLFVAIGTVLTIVGSQVTSREDAKQATQEVKQQVDRAFEALNAAKLETDDPEALKEEIAAVESEFRRWANAFIADRERRFNRLSQAKLAVSQNEIELSDLARPFAAEFIRVLEGLGSALAESDHRVTEIYFPPLPLNLFKDYHGHITFDSGSKLAVKTAGEGIVQILSRLPRLLVSFSETQEYPRSDFLMLNFTREEVSIMNVGKQVPEGFFPATVPNDPRSPQLGELARKIMELQMFLLEEQPPQKE